MGNARLEKFLRDIRTYRVAFEDLATDTGAGAKIAVELFGSDNKHVKLRHVQISKPTIGIAPFQLNFYSVGSTGSTGETQAVDAQMKQGDATYSGIVRLYTVSPDASTGTLLNTLQEIDISTGEVMNEAFGDRGVIQSVTLTGSTQSVGIVITSTGANTLNGYVEFTEEP